MLLAAFMLASIGGRYSWPVVPALIAAAGLFLLSGARIAADQSTRALDITVMILLALIGLQLLPLPSPMLNAVSPASPGVQDAYVLAPLGLWRPVSIHPAATRAGFTLALMAALVFWASREAFSHGGSRTAARLLAGLGFACALVSLALKRNSFFASSILSGLSFSRRSIRARFPSDRSSIATSWRPGWCWSSAWSADTWRCMSART